MKRRAECRENMVVTSVALDQGLHRRLAIAALLERTARAEVIRQAVSEWLERQSVRVKRGRGREHAEQEVRPTEGGLEETDPASR